MIKLINENGVPMAVLTCTATYGTMQELTRTAEKLSEILSVETGMLNAAIDAKKNEKSAVKRAATPTKKSGKSDSELNRAIMNFLADGSSYYLGDIALKIECKPPRAKKLLERLLEKGKVVNVIGPSGSSFEEIEWKIAE